MSLLAVRNDFKGRLFRTTHFIDNLKKKTFDEATLPMKGKEANGHQAT